VGRADFADRDRRELHRLVAEAFDEAAELVGAPATSVRVGRDVVRIRTAGPALARPLTRALGHLAVDPATPPTATIDAFDSATTGRPLPLLVVHLLRLLDVTWLEDRDYRGGLRAFADGPVRAAYYGPRLFSVYDVERRAGVYWLPDATELPWYEPGAPFRVLMDWIVAGPTTQLVHAGALAGPTGGVMLGGAGGSGKSTTALACLGATGQGLRYVSDDYVVVDVPDDAAAVPTVTSIYCTAKLKSLTDLDRFGELRDAVVNEDRSAVDAGDPDAEKPMLFVHEHAPERLAAVTPVRAVVFPKYLGLDECEVTPISTEQAFRRLAPSTVQQMPLSGTSALRVMRALTQRVPAFHLGLPTDRRKIPSAVAGILSEVS
jgi:hypothetical protein